MQKRKKGFVLIETIIVTSVLILSLMLVYENFNSATSTEKTKIRYDDMADIYKAFYLKDYIENNTFKGKGGNDVPLNIIAKYKNSSGVEDYIDKMDNYQVTSGCPIYYNEIKCDTLGTNLCKALSVNKIYVVRYNYLEYLKQNSLASSFTNCFGGDLDLATYVKKMGITDIEEYGSADGVDKFQLIVEFNKNINDGSNCAGDNCVKTFASININMDDGREDW